MKIGRETMDLDFLLTQLSIEMGSLEEMCKEISMISLDDGFKFAFVDIELLSQPHMNYPGYRITFSVNFAKMKDKIHIDIGIGDVVKPQQLDIKLFEYRGKPLFENTVSLLVYPPETIFAEKLETIISKGSKNSRMKDYHDLLLLARNESNLESKKLTESIKNTFEKRGTLFGVISFNQDGIKSLQKLWTAHLNGLGSIAHELELPQDIKAVIEVINIYINGL
jgi:hypothetical protein